MVVEGTYHTPYQEHAYIEPNGMIAVPDGTGGVVVYGSMQCPFYVQKAVASALGCDLNRARIVQTVTGGGFGGKEDAPSAPGAHVALLAMATRPAGAPDPHARRGHGGDVEAPPRRASGCAWAPPATGT